MKSTVVLLFLLLSASAFASQLAILPATKVRYESDGLGRSGKVTVEIKSGEIGRVLAVKVTAFGVEYDLSKEHLAQLEGFSCNGIILGFETGFSDAGEVVYVTLVRGVMGDVIERVIISIPRSGAVKLERTKK